MPHGDASNIEMARILRERAQWDLLRRLMPMLSDDEIAEEVTKARKAIQKKLLADLERRKT